MKKKRINNIDEHRLLTFTFSIQFVLYKLGLFLLIILIFLQTLHYNRVFQKALNPTYVLEEDFTTKDTFHPSYGIFYFSSNVEQDDDIIIRINGIPVKKLEKDKSTFAYISLLDIIEIDATKTSRAYQVIIEAEPMSFLPQGYNRKLDVHGKLYRLSPLY